ncbi:MAG: hypothetical protein DME75_05440 [Verrucomicrobia bacterium]|nr:MAG: hypothetical protein DME75_05440 [Verrucomicrobiota bacterium]
MARNYSIEDRSRSFRLASSCSSWSNRAHDYVPELLRRVRRRFPIFRLQLHEAARADAERLLQAGEIDVAITIIDSKRRPEIHSRPLLELPLILLVNKKHHLTTAK